MAEPFIPLSARRQPGAPFRSLATTIPSPAEPPALPCSLPAEPQVTLVRDGEKITHIKIQCRCGEVIELACAY
jgi:hypothetical protein